MCVCVCVCSQASQFLTLHDCGWHIHWYVIIIDSVILLNRCISTGLLTGDLRSTLVLSTMTAKPCVQLGLLRCLSGLLFSVLGLLSSLLMLMCIQSIACCRDDRIVSSEGRGISHKTGTGNRHDISNAEHLQVALAIIWSVNRSLWQWFRLYRQ